MKLVHDINEAELRDKMTSFINAEMEKELRIQLLASYNTGAYGRPMGEGFRKLQELIVTRTHESIDAIDGAAIEKRFNALFDSYFNDAFSYALDREARKAAHLLAVKMAKRKVKAMHDKVMTGKEE